MRRALMIGGALAAFLSHAALANLIQAPASSPITVSLSPTNPTVQCNAAPGTVVSTATASGPATFDVNPKTDFAMSGNQVVVGSSGIAQSECPSSCAVGAVCTTDNVTVTATSAAISPDGTVSNAPSGAMLITGAGDWTWGAATGDQTYVMLNGSVASGGYGSEMKVDNGGVMYVFNSGLNQWYQWNPSISNWDTYTGSGTP